MPLPTILEVSSLINTCMTLIVFGINHKTAPVEIREKVAFSPDTLVDALDSLGETSGVQESVIVSTCNRTEVYVRGRQS